MHRMFTPTVLLSLLVFVCGCGSSSTANRGSPPVQPMPHEYIQLAEAIAFELKPSQEQYRELSPTEATAALQNGISTLGNLKSDDPDIVSLAMYAKESSQEFLMHIDKIKSMPQPEGFASLLTKSFLGGMYAGYSGDPTGLAAAFSSAFESQSKSDGLIAEVKEILSACDKVDVAQQRLPHIAAKYAAAPSDLTGRLVVDFDGAWGPAAQRDWMRLFNSGPDDLENCTVQVILIGSNASSRRNVHFIRRWPAKTWVYAKYEYGEEILGRSAFRTTVPELQEAEISLWSPKCTITQRYVYQGSERDKDIAKACESLRLTGQYLPFVRGIVWNTERGVEFTLEGIESIPAFHADVTFRKGAEVKSMSYNHDGWKQREKKRFISDKGQLAFDPSQVDITITFPNTNHQPKSTLQIK